VAGHLYLFQTGGLALAASLGELTPPDGLMGFAQQFVDRDSEAADQVTVQVDAIVSKMCLAPLTFTDAVGHVYRPMLMTSAVDGRLAYTGMAVVRGGAALSGTPLLDAIGAELAAFGDTERFVAHASADLRGG
jgi:hypothetical protein